MGGCFVQLSGLILCRCGRATETQAGIAVTVWLAMGLITDFLFIPFIDRQKDSMKFLRITAIHGIICICCFSAYARLYS